MALKNFTFQRQSLKIKADRIKSDKLQSYFRIWVKTRIVNEREKAAVDVLSFSKLKLVLDVWRQTT